MIYVLFATVLVSIFFSNLPILTKYNPIIIPIVITPDIAIFSDLVYKYPKEVRIIIVLVIAFNFFCDCCAS